MARETLRGHLWADRVCVWADRACAHAPRACATQASAVIKPVEQSVKQLSAAGTEGAAPISGKVSPPSA